ncbi:MAG TPA: 16S rRNA (guanine(966)-N(2))-methyltransferase RsmD [Syntrophales bacterium]|nr:16S rRNA (guanine(966)-N(2))-methyltransferase RsmD [Syntrophales bacterium]
MRIIGGDAKGRSLRVPVRTKVRPTSDSVKEALFNILSSVKGKTFLDVFAGSGNIGIEALSRGASWAVFIENNRALSQFIKKNLLQCRVDGRYEIMDMEVKKALQILQKNRAQFDIIFADPPYEEGRVEETLCYFANGKLFSEDSLLIIQHSSREALRPGLAKELILTDQRRYGDTILSFLKYIDKGTENML